MTKTKGKLGLFIYRRLIRRANKIVVRHACKQSYTSDDNQENHETTDRKWKK